MNFFTQLGHSIAAFFKGHQATIQTTIGYAQNAAGAASAVAGILGESPAVTSQIGKISDALGLVSATVTAETSAETLTQHAANLSALTSALVNSGDIGIKNAQTQAAVGTVAVKVQGVVGALETAANAATPAV